MKPSPLTLALPFIVSAVFFLLGPLIGLAIEARLKKTYTTWLNADVRDHEAVEATLVSYAPKTVAKSSVWAIDAAQILGAVLLPVLGVILIKPSLGTTAVYVVASCTALGGLLYFLFKVPPDTYHTMGPKILKLGKRRKKLQLRLTPVTGVGIGLNVVAAFVAALVGT